MNWRFWQKKAPPIKRPRVSFETMDDERINVVCDWPDGATDQDKMKTAAALGSMLHYINDGQLLQLMQHAVVAAGHLKDDTESSRYVLHALAAMMSRAKQEESGRPVVPADQVFSRD